MTDPATPAPSAESAVAAPPQVLLEIDEVATGKVDYADSPLSNAPHTMDMVLSGSWDKAYSREVAAFPAAYQRGSNAAQAKQWPTVGRVDNDYGDRNHICTCPPLSSYEEDVSA